ncbi:hypothetical protein SprV_0902725400 [Sparganum proliferum]
MLVMASDSMNSNICYYEPPAFTATSGPVNITILSPKTPQEIRMPDVYANWLIANGSCVSEEIGKPDFPCPMTCDTAKFVEDENSPEDTLATAGNTRQHNLTWHVSTSESVTSKPFVCLDNNHLICSGVTSTDEPGRCCIREQDHSFQYSLAVDNPLNESTAYYCYIGGKVQAKSVLRSGVAIEDQLNAYICHPANFTGLVEQCPDESFEFTISDPVYDSSEVYSLLEHTGAIDASLLLRRILEGALQNSCKNGPRSRVSYNEDLESAD